ncbi:MAG: DUF6383 domain-containing protein, partial [Bacteroidales bacterium]|nr:DUF6383 domain-containing protein [Bacteroidales bacterium]
MKKFLPVFSFLFGSVLGASAIWLPTPVITEETVGDTGVTISWTYDDSQEPCDHFQVIVYKMHKATKDESFVLAETDFDYIHSTGTMKEAKCRGAVWDFIPECPGWWAKFPWYMEGAIGLNTFHNYPGSDNSDIFGGVYLASPDYDLSNLANPEIKVEANLANEYYGVTGGFALFAWNTNWWDPKNIDYKPVYNNDYHYTDLSNTKWSAKSETLSFPNIEDFTDPEQIEEIEGIDMTRSRVVFYGSGSFIYWINDFRLTVDMVPGDMVDYGAAIYEVTDRSFTIDTTSDTDDDYVYAYEVRPIRLDYDDYYDATTVRFIDHAHLNPRHIIGKFSGIDGITSDKAETRIFARDGKIVINGAEGLTANVFNIAGKCVYSGTADAPIALERGIYIVKAGDTTAKIVL